MGQVLSISGYGGGVVLEGSADAQRTDELFACDAYDIGPRGQLVVASELTTFADALGAGAVALSLVRELGIIGASQAPQIIAVGNSGTDTWISLMTPDTGALSAAASAGATHAAGWNVTMAFFPYVDATGVQLRLVLVSIGARSAFNPRAGLGVFAVTFNPAGPSYAFRAMSQYDALGTGPNGEAASIPGSKGKQLYARGVLAYNSHALCWGFDSHDATTGDGPNRVMFSNIGNPLKFGFDPSAQGIADGTLSETDRDFVDSDAILIGGAGDIIRAGLVWAGRAWFGGSAGMHYVEGYGRESFQTNGAVAVAGSKNVIGPHALVEGPDRLLHAIGDEGHWIFDGAATDPVGNKLRDFDTKSNGWWDLIWTDASRTLASFPGQTNQDLVWMLSDPAMRQVLIGIPYCDASAGYGFGADTVVIKFHVDTRGYTRQVFAGKILLTAAAFRREHTAIAQQFVGGSGLGTNVSRYRYKATAAASPAMPAVLPDVTFGEYAPFGPDGVGVLRRRYLTLRWNAGSALPIVFSLTPVVDGETLASVKLSIQASAPGTPANGDFWLDTSGTDTNLGNGTAGAIVKAHAADFIFKEYVTTWAKWVNIPTGGQQGTRVSLPIAFDYARGTRFKVRALCTAAAGRFQIEGFGENPAIVRDAE